MSAYQIQLKLPRFLDDHYEVIVLTALIVLLGVWGYVDYADAEYCSKTCRSLKEAKEAETIKKAENNIGSVPEAKVIRDLSTKNFISLRVSNTCKKLDSTQCPNEKELADMYDNSNKYLSGDFYFDNKTQAWKRSSPKIPNVFELYKFIDHMPWVLWVNPDDYTWDRSKKIIIEPSLHYIDRSDKIDESRIRYEYEGLSMKHCASATIGWENGGQEILLDVLNHFYSNCREPVKYDPTIEIFMGSKVFENCDKACLYYKDNFKREIKAEALSNKQPDKVIKSTEPICYGIYCKKEKQTTEQTVKSLEDKEKIRLERLKELEDIQKCERLQREDRQAGRTDIKDIDCKNVDQRNKYLVGR